MNYQFDTIINKQEANALKEMIFRRAKERAEALNEIEQKDIMDLARSSFESKNNPFAQIIAQETKEPQKVVETEHVVQNENEKEAQIGFPQREVKLKQSSTTVENIIVQEIRNTMQEAHESLSNKQSFMGALNFLNSQAAISLIRTRADKFEVLA